MTVMTGIWVGIAAQEQRNVCMAEQRGENCQGRSVSRGATDYEHGAVCTVGDEMGEDIGSAKQDAEVSETVFLWASEFLAP